MPNESANMRSEQTHRCGPAAVPALAPHPSITGRNTMPRTHLVAATHPKTIATYQIQTKLYEIKEAATILLTFSLASLPDGFVTIPGCILACKWVNCHGCDCVDGCCCNCASLDEIALDESKLRKEAVESRGCGCQVIGWLAVAFCCDIGLCCRRGGYRVFLPARKPVVARL